MKNQIQKTSPIIPSDVAKYFLYRAIQDGDLVSPLKMQKLVYYAYSWTLVNNKKKLFEEKMEAWPSGPVVPSLYGELKIYGSAPIDEDYLGVSSTNEFNEVICTKFPADIKVTLDKVYEGYMTKTAFELVALTHSEKPWSETRKGLSPTEPSNKTIPDNLIIQQYGQQK
ncbi:DUF4065 domain-containing protein [Patescibacteria group bacterium]|nr:DUF4065 domain-containing protein [Patescibacteria group bacterium]